MATKKSKNPLTAMTAGCIAGAVEATCVWPMEFIKVRRSSKTYKPKLWSYMEVLFLYVTVTLPFGKRYFQIFLSHLFILWRFLTFDLFCFHHNNNCVTMTLSIKKKDTITIAITYQRCTITIYWYGIRINLYCTEYRIF